MNRIAQHANVMRSIRGAAQSHRLDHPAHGQIVDDSVPFDVRLQRSGNRERENGRLIPRVKEASSEDPEFRMVLPRIFNPTADPIAMRIPATGALSTMLFSMLTFAAV
jgi:hypothetical protein